MNTYRKLANRIFGGFVPRIELLSGVLSQTSWIMQRGPKLSGNRYFRNLSAFFNPFRNHEAILCAERLTQSGFTYDAPPNFILGLSSLPDLIAPGGFSDYLIGRAGGVNRLNEFREALVELCRESNFLDFFSGYEKDFIRWADKSFTTFDGTRVSQWLEDFFGWTAGAFHIVLAPAMFSGGGYGASFVVNDELVVYQITREIGLSETDPDFGDGIDIGHLALHELGHAYINPSIEEHQSTMEDLELYDFYEPVKEKMQAYAYGNYIIFFIESLLRAMTAIAISGSDHSNREKINVDQISIGFYLQRFFVSQLEEYQTNRNRYPSFRDFVPDLLDQLHMNRNRLLEAQAT